PGQRERSVRSQDTSVLRLEISVHERRSRRAADSLHLWPSRFDVIEDAADPPQQSVVLLRETLVRRAVQDAAAGAAKMFEVAARAGIGKPRDAGHIRGEAVQSPQHGAGDHAVFGIARVEAA